jgi:protein gp37
MGADSKIEWTHHTFNPWWGCFKVSPGCKHCYAESLSKRFGHTIWGPPQTTSRRLFGDSHWGEPLRWNQDAAEAGRRARVFCASMADVFEDHPQVEEPRRRLFELIGQTPHLDWLLLTKRPENILPLTRRAIDPFYGPSGNEMAEPNGLDVAEFGELYPNVWLGTSVEDQQRADERIPQLLQVPATVRFLSCEPLLGPVTLFDTSEGVLRGPAVIVSGGMTPSTPDSPPEGYDDSYAGIDWVICGGESGTSARPMQLAWARSLRDQCQAAGVAYHFKQWGEFLPRSQMIAGVHCSDGEQGSQPDDRFIRLGKGAAGRLLDGRMWDELPEISEVVR